MPWDGQQVLDKRNLNMSSLQQVGSICGNSQINAQLHSYATKLLVADYSIKASTFLHGLVKLAQVQFLACKKCKNVFCVKA